MSRGIKLEPEVTQQINEMLDKDITHRAIADKLGVSCAAVSRQSALRRSKPLGKVRLDKWARDFNRDWSREVERIKDQYGMGIPSREHIAEVERYG